MEGGAGGCEGGCEGNGSGCRNLRTAGLASSRSCSAARWVASHTVADASPKSATHWPWVFLSPAHGAVAARSAPTAALSSRCGVSGDVNMVSSISSFTSRLQALSGSATMLGPGACATEPLAGDTSAGGAAGAFLLDSPPFSSGVPFVAQRLVPAPLVDRDVSQSSMLSKASAAACTPPWSVSRAALDASREDLFDGNGSGMGGGCRHVAVCRHSMADWQSGRSAELRFVGGIR